MVWKTLTLERLTVEKTVVAEKFVTTEGIGAVANIMSVDYVR